MRPRGVWLIERALRDEGTSLHYRPPARWSHLDPTLTDRLQTAFHDLEQPVLPAASWTTDAPYRETAAALSHAREAGAVCVEMESAALYAYSAARRQHVVCLRRWGLTMGDVDRERAAAMNRVDIQAELLRARADFHQLVAGATPQDLRRRSDGTRWTNRQLLWHMVFGYLIVRTLLPLVHLLGRLGLSRRFAATLNALHRPFHLINYAGTAGGGLLLPPRRMAAIMDRTINALSRRLAAEPPESLALTMHFPTRWDPYFRDTMSVLDVYHYGTEHYDHHHRQLTLTPPRT